MANEPNNLVLEERLKQLNEDFNYFRKNTREELKEIKEDVDSTRRVADEVNRSMTYIEKTVNKMDGVMTTFIAMVGKQNDKIDEFVSMQNTKIDEFVNSDKRMSHKRQFIISILQVASGIFATIIGFLIAGKM